MINHARTLLLNQPGKNYAPGTIGEEYTPRDYVPVNLPSYVLFPHRILFGTAPDKVFLNFRAKELLGLIHSTELAEFIYALDPRVTYWPAAGADFFSAPRAIRVEKSSGYTRAKIYVRGKQKADNNAGRCFNNYFVRLLGEDSGISAAITSSASEDEALQPLSFLSANSGLSNAITVPNSDLELQFSNVEDFPPEVLLLEEFDYSLLTQDYDALSLEPGDLLPFTAAPKLMLPPERTVLVSWQIQSYARPAPAISACLPQLELLGEPLFLELFGVRDDVEPYATFKNIWFNHPAPNYRLAAFVMAMIYRTAEIRR